MNIHFIIIIIIIIVVIIIMIIIIIVMIAMNVTNTILFTEFRLTDWLQSNYNKFLQRRIFENRLSVLTRAESRVTVISFRIHIRFCGIGVLVKSVYLLKDFCFLALAVSVR